MWFFGIGTDVLLDQRSERGLGQVAVAIDPRVDKRSTSCGGPPGFVEAVPAALTAR